MSHSFLPINLRWHIAVLARHAIDIRSQYVVRQVPARHVLYHIFLVNDFAIAVEVLPSLRGHGEGPVTSVVTLEERERVAAGHDPGALVVQERRGVSFEDGDVVVYRDGFEGERGAQATQRTADL